jgi:hypothetical protein
MMPAIARDGHDEGQLVSSPRTTPVRGSAYSATILAIVEP